MVRGWSVPDGDFTTFCDREYPQVLGALSLWCGDRGVAEEVTAEAFARAYRDWRKVRHLDAPGAWVRRVAINLATSTFRRRRTERRARRRIEAGTTSVSRDPDGADTVTVRAALQRLSEDHRTVLVLRYYLDLPVDEVARLTGRSASGVTSLTHRAAAAFREVLDVTEPPAGVAEVDHER
jgi:RNA polymerase sigma factor (sigma-70 family)